MKILITGGAGFIGSHTVGKMLDLGYTVICIDNFNSYYDPKIKEQNILKFKKNKKFHLYRKDIRKIRTLEEIFKTEKPDKVCHLAASVGVRNSIKFPEGYIKTNINATLNLLKLSVKYHIKNFVFASSSSVYGESKKTPFFEDDPADKPVSPYAATKRAGELLIYTYHYLYGLPATILRFFTVYGPSGRPDMAPYLFVDSIMKGKSINKYGGGETKRDYTYIDDIVDGITRALKRDLQFAIVNLGNNNPISLNYFISLIEKILGKKTILKKFSLQPGDVTITYADISKAQKLLGISPKTTIEEGMKKFISWYLKNVK